MVDKELEIKLEKYLENNWEQILTDIETLVKVPSYAAEDGSDYSEKYPTGEYPAKAMSEAVKIAERLGFETKNFQNHIGIADIPGKSKTMLGFIGHCDVVPDGYGWKFDPFKLTRHEGYIIGRGVIDDKGPTVVALHAAKFLNDNGFEWPYTFRFMFGTDEENGMTDVECYLNNFKEPAVTITPDADFPICYGEKGLVRCKVSSPIINDGQLSYVWAGVADNIVAGHSRAVIQLKRGESIFKRGSRLAHAIMIEPLENNKAQITCKGRSAHASTPYEGIDAIAILSQFLIEKGVGNKQEQDFLKFLSKVAGRPAGDGIGLNCSDEHFGNLTIVPSQLWLQDGRIHQVFDCRFPTVIDAESVVNKVAQAAPEGCETTMLSAETPFLVDPESKLMKALSKSYTDATGEAANLFTMGGSTYSRHFKCASSFGPEMPWIPNPAWVGSIHGADEAISEDNLKKAFKIYAYAIKNIMQLDLDSGDFMAKC